MSDRPRLFAALDIPPKAVEEAMIFQKLMKKAGIFAKWVPFENMHLTLKFIGETDPENISLIKETINEICGDFAPFRLIIKGAGVFPNAHRPAVAWSGLEGETELVMKLARLIDKNLYEKIEIKRETKGFKPHLTVARFKTKINENKISLIIDEISELEPFSFVGDKVTLYQSHLTREGAKYTALESFQLKGNL